MVERRITYNLIIPFDYAHHSDGSVEAKFITMDAPTVRNLKYLAPLKQSFTRALTQAQNGQDDDSSKDDASSDSAGGVASDAATPDETNDKVDPVMIISLIESSSEDMACFVQKFSTFCIDSGLVLIDGEIKITASLLQKMDIADFYNVMGKYLSCFIIASLLK